ncbi:MAG TPA: hypothetical protein VIC57_12010, partial [Candidatus Dormibacteraeota bacterium]
LAVAAAVASAVGITFSLSRVPILIAALLTVAGPVVALGVTRDRWRQVAGYVAASAVAFVIVLGVAAVTSPRVGPADLAAQAPIDLGSEGSHQATLARAADLRPLLLGQGLGTAGYLSSKYASSGATIGYENPYLDAAAQVSLLGGLLLIAIVTLSSLELLRVRGPSAIIAIPTGITLGSLALGGFVSGQLEVITSLGVTWLFVGVVLAATADVPAEAPAGALEPAPRRRDRASPAQSRP